MKFDWDTEKERLNLEKHGVTFADAVQVFGDPNLILTPDRVDDDGEQRWHALGIAVGAALQPVLLVVHVYRESLDGKEIIRIISARKASRRERRGYSQ